MSDAAVGDFIVVRWIDASFEMDKMPALALAETAGWLCYLDDNCIVVASERFDDATYRAYTCVPACAIQEVRHASAD